MTTIRSHATTIGQALREARGAAGLTTRDLGAAVGVAPGTISNWERDIFEPSLSQIIRFADATNQPADMFIGGLIGLARSKGLEPPTF